MMTINFPFNTFGLEVDEIDSFYNTFNQLKTKFQPCFIDEFDYDFSEFNSFNNSINISTDYLIDLNTRNQNSFISFTRVGYIYSGARGGERFGSEYQAWGILNLQKDYGTIYIRRETFADKIFELIKPIELDFEDDLALSKKFYVLTNDKEKAYMALNSSFRNAVLNLPLDDIEIEVNNKMLIVGNHKRVDPESAFHIAEFLNTISSVV